MTAPSPLTDDEVTALIGAWLSMSDDIDGDLSLRALFELQRLRRPRPPGEPPEKNEDSSLPKTAGPQVQYADVDDTMWIGVNSLDVPDISTLHVDERDCQLLIDNIVYKDGAVFSPRRCTLSIHAATRALVGDEGCLWPVEIMRDAAEISNGTLDGIVHLVVREVAELPDRTSPAELPDMMLVTADELEAAIRNAIYSAIAYAPTKPLGVLHTIRAKSDKERNGASLKEHIFGSKHTDLGFVVIASDRYIVYMHITKSKWGSNLLPASWHNTPVEYHWDVGEIVAYGQDYD